MKPFVYFAFILIFLISGSVYSQKVLTAATVEGGKVGGIIEKEVGVFKGIPFAAPPVNL